MYIYIYAVYTCVASNLSPNFLKSKNCTMNYIFFISKFEILLYNLYFEVLSAMEKNV